MSRNVRYCQEHGHSLVVAIPPAFRRLLRLKKGTPVLWTMPEPGKGAVQNVERHLERLGKEA